MRVFRYLKDHVVATLLIFVLLIGQAFCDLALPRYTSDIVTWAFSSRVSSTPLLRF